METWRVRRPLDADSYHFDEIRIRIKVDSRSENSDPGLDPHPSEKVGFGSASTDKNLGTGSMDRIQTWIKLEIAPQNTNSPTKLF
jgi:hypothetical protein